MNKQQQSSTLVMAFAIIAATMLVFVSSSRETLDLFDDAEAKKTKKSKSKKHGSGGGPRPD